MKNVYLENTNNHHDKFYHMIENKDGASFTASWGRTGSNGRTQIYGMNEWDKKYREKISRGYKKILIPSTPPSNWIHGMASSNIDENINLKKDFSKPMTLDRKNIGEKLLRLRSRIEDWASLNGWKNMDNQSERKNKNGDVVWKRSDWECIDGMYGCIINGDEHGWTGETLKKLNKMWKQYEIDVTIVKPENPNFVSDWEQLQQMEWDEVSEEVTLGDPAMGVKN